MKIRVKDQKPAETVLEFELKVDEEDGLELLCNGEHLVWLVGSEGLVCSAAEQTLVASLADLRKRLESKP